MSKLLVLGATGGTGRCIVSQALERGHEVTAFVRSPEKRATTGVKVVVGSIPENADALVEAMRGQDVVISALGRGKTFKPDGLIARSTPAIVKAMKTAGVRRLIFTSAFGVSPAHTGIPFFPRLFMGTLLRNIYADKRAGESALFASDLDWTLVYPSMLNDGPKTGKYRVGEQLELSGFPKISRADVADFILNQVASRVYVRKGVIISC